VPAHTPGESIEGLKIQGHSRDPLRYQRTAIINGIKCFLFKANFNVFAKISAALPEGTSQIDETAFTIEGESLGCDSALITTIAKGRTPRQRDLFQQPVSHASHTHGATEWESKHQTNVRIDIPRQDVINAQIKRNNNLQLTHTK
jgi:hypothetical protein